MKLKKQGDFLMLHSDNDLPMYCPHQDGGSTVEMTQDSSVQVAGKQPSVKQVIHKNHMICGTWCALFRHEQDDTNKDYHAITQGCNSNRKTDGEIDYEVVTVEQ
jgi:hypothetical protein